MPRQFRLLLGISVFWLALSVLTDGVNTLVLPLQLGGLVGKNVQATALGLLTFGGLLAGALIQPYAGALSDRFRPQLGRRGFIAFGLLLSLAALLFFASLHSLPGVMLGYFGIQLAASVAQAGQQGLIPDLVGGRHRGMASGLKGFMDIAGAMVGFAVLGQLLGTGRVGLALTAIAVTLIVVYAVAVLLTPEDRPVHDRTLATTKSARAVPLSFRQVFSIDVREHGGFVRLIWARFLFLLGVYSIGRFLLYFVADRLHLAAGQAAAQAGTILAVLALVTIIASPIGGWLSDRIGRVPLMSAGAILGAASALLLIIARSQLEILMFGGLMSLGSAAFSGGSWALLADLVPKREAARFFGLANLSTAGSSAVAGLLGPLFDFAQRVAPGSGYTTLFTLAALAFAASLLPIRSSLLKEAHNAGQVDRARAQGSSHAARLAVVPVSAHPAAPEEDQDPPAGPPAS